MTEIGRRRGLRHPGSARIGLALLEARLCASQAGAARARTAAVRPDRPRIFLRPPQIAAWRQRFQRIPARREVYAATRRDLFSREEPAATRSETTSTRAARAGR